MFKNKTRLDSNFHFRDSILKYVTSGVVCKSQFELCNESYHGECMRQLNIRIGEHTNIPPLTEKYVQRSLLREPLNNER